MRGVTSRCIKPWERGNRIDVNMLLLEISNLNHQVTKNLWSEKKLIHKKLNHILYAERR